MPHPIHRVTHVEVTGPYTLAVTFADGTAQEINFEPVLHGILFGPLRDLATFNAVRVDLEVGTLTWPNGADASLNQDARGSFGGVGRAP